MSPSNMSLMIVGPGELGSRVAAMWRKLHKDADIFLKSRRSLPERTARWKELGFREAQEGTKADFVLFCAPPSDGYDSAMSEALSSCWSRNGRFVFSSSGGVYKENCGGGVDENSEVKTDEDPGPHSRHSTLIVKCEKMVLEYGGTVLRLGGLYHLQRGAHNFWLTSGRSPFTSSPVGLINLIHYDDAASAVIAAFHNDVQGKLFLLADGVPVSRSDICAAARKNPDFEKWEQPEFKGEAVVDGKRYDVSRARKELKDWSRVHESFADFCVNSYRQEMKVTLLNN